MPSEWAERSPGRSSPAHGARRARSSRCATRCASGRRRSDHLRSDRLRRRTRALAAEDVEQRGQVERRRRLLVCAAAAVVCGVLIFGALGARARDAPSSALHESARVRATVTVASVERRRRRGAFRVGSRGGQVAVGTTVESRRSLGSGGGGRVLRWVPGVHCERREAEHFVFERATCAAVDRRRLRLLWRLGAPPRVRERFEEIHRMRSDQQ